MLFKNFSRKLLLVLIVFSSFCFFNANSQVVKLSGTLVDSKKQPLKDASIVISRIKDSAVIDFLFTTQTGIFELEITYQDSFMVEFSYPGYHTKTLRMMGMTNEGSVASYEVGNLQLKLDTSKTSEITVKASAIRMKNDTMIIDASRFKVLPGSNLDVLLKKIPGFNIDSKGNITINGVKVDKILVDGSEFFGSNPGLVVKNIRAAFVGGLYVYDERERDGSLKIGTGKTINVKLKKGKNSGLFGDALMGYGNDHRYELGFRLNKFKGDKKFSAIINSNNINNKGFDFGFSNWNYLNEINRPGGEMIDAGNNQFLWRFGKFEESEIPGIKKQSNAGFTFVNRTKSRWKISSTLSLKNIENKIKTESSIQTIVDSLKTINSQNIKSTFNKSNGADVRFSATKQQDSVTEFAFSLSLGSAIANNNVINNRNIYNNLNNNYQFNRNDFLRDNYVGLSASFAKYSKKKFNQFAEFNMYSNLYSQNGNIISTNKGTGNLYDSIAWQSNLKETKWINTAEIKSNIPLTKKFSIGQLVQAFFSNWNKNANTFNKTSFNTNKESYNNQNIDSFSYDLNNTWNTLSYKPTLKYFFKNGDMGAGLVNQFHLINNTDKSHNEFINRNFYLPLPSFYCVYNTNKVNAVISVDKYTQIPTASQLQTVRSIQNLWSNIAGNIKLNNENIVRVLLQNHWNINRGKTSFYYSLYSRFFQNPIIYKSVVFDNGFTLSLPVNGSKGTHNSFTTGIRKKIRNFSVNIRYDFSNETMPIIISDKNGNAKSLSHEPAVEILFSPTDSLEITLEFNPSFSNYSVDINSNLQYKNKFYDAGFSGTKIFKKGTKFNTTLNLLDRTSVPGIGKLLPMLNAFLEIPLIKKLYVKITGINLLNQNAQQYRFSNLNTVNVVKNLQLGRVVLGTLIYRF